MSAKVLLVEDSEHKRGRVLFFLSESFPDFKVLEAQSFNSACKLIDTTRFDIVLMDMSMPTYDRSPTESGGRFRTFGGRELARKIMRKGVDTRVVFLTQYDAFSASVGSHTLETLGEALKNECGVSYGGLIHYDSSKSSWKEQLESVLKISP